jgi:3-hydroxyisobutyrate dehydrogenase
MKVGLVGLGRMGRAIHGRLAESGFEVTGWDRDGAAAKAAAGRGLRLAAHPRAVAEATDVVISIITEDNGVRQVFRGENGFLQANVAGKLFIEMSTLQPMTGRELAPLVEAAGARLIEAPVLGSIPTVREASSLRSPAAAPMTWSARAPCSASSPARSSIWGRTARATR